MERFSFSGVPLPLGVSSSFQVSQAPSWRAPASDDPLQPLYASCHVRLISPAAAGDETKPHAGEEDPGSQFC